MNNFSTSKIIPCAMNSILKMSNLLCLIGSIRFYKLYNLDFNQKDLFKN